MSRILLIARREYAAYARTVGFWLSLLALPIFAVLGGGLPLLMRGAEPVRAVAIVSDAPEASGLASAVREALRSDQDRRRIAALRVAAIPEGGTAAGDRVRRVAETEGYEAGLGALKREAPRAGAGFRAPRQSLRLVEAPREVVGAAPGPERDAAVRRFLGDDIPRDQRLNAIVFLTDATGQPSARVWTARASDSAVEEAIREALRTVNRQAVFARAGIDPAVVAEAERFRPEIGLFSPRSSSGGEVAFRDRLPGVIGLAAGFLLWSLIITGASILLNSVMEEKANRILEVLLSSASATEILTGKVLGVALLTLTVLAVWVGIGALGLSAGVPDIARDVGAVLTEGWLWAYFLVFMVGGYLMYAVLFAAIGAFCETPRDAQTLMGPIMMVLVVPLLAMQMAVRTPDALAVKALSWIPFFTPFLMTARAPSEPPLYEVAAAGAGMALVAALMIWSAGRAFRAGALSDVKLNWKSFFGAVRGGR